MVHVQFTTVHTVVQLHVYTDLRSPVVAAQYFIGVHIQVIVSTNVQFVPRGVHD